MLVSGAERVLAADVRVVADVLASLFDRDRKLAAVMDAAQHRLLGQTTTCGVWQRAGRPVPCVAICRMRSSRRSVPTSMRRMIVAGWVYELRIMRRRAIVVRLGPRRDGHT